MNEITETVKKYWKEILFLILVVVAYYKIKEVIAAAKRKAADKVTKDVIQEDIDKGGGENMDALAAQIYQDIYGTWYDSNEANIIRILNLVGVTGYPLLKKSYESMKSVWGTPFNLMSDLNTCMTTDDFKLVNYSPY
mgnify:CR=1 FL=1